MLATLTDPTVCTATHLGSKWSATSILDTIASSGTEGSVLPRIRALIDTGALITGMSNEEVAWYLLTKGGEGANAGLVHCDGVVFLDDADRKMVSS